MHVKSGVKIFTDAPVDNHGKGEAFSPTDLMSASLGSCMLTVMGIAANTHNIVMKDVKVKITKIMNSKPRKVAEIIVEFEMPDVEYTEKEKKILEHAALTCPVALSLNPELKQKVSFNYPMNKKSE